jgi:hypothetical protein
MKSPSKLGVIMLKQYLGTVNLSGAHAVNVGQLHQPIIISGR